MRVNIFKKTSCKMSSATALSLTRRWMKAFNAVWVSVQMIFAGAFIRSVFINVLSILNGCFIQSFSKPESKVHQQDQRRHFDKGANDPGKCLSGIDPKNAHGYGNGQLKIIARGGERHRGVLLVAGAQSLRQNKT